MEKRELDFTHKRILVTAGPTREKIDPVRFISNHSTGKMGYSIAKAAAERGAEVLLISGPTELPAPMQCEVINIESAVEMFEAVQQHYNEYDILIMTAAVGDYRPENFSEEKIKKSEDTLYLKLIKNPDIAQFVGNNKTKQLLIGFAAESCNEIEYGKTKLKKKNFDMICINNIKSKEIGFGSDFNEMTLITKTGEVYPVPYAPKYAVANFILDCIKTL